LYFSIFFVTEIFSSNPPLIYFFDFPGGIFGESFIVKQMLPLLKNVVRSFTDVSFVNKPDPVQSWSSLALVDCMMTLDGLVAFLTEEVIVKELLEVCFVVLFWPQKALNTSKYCIKLNY